MQTNVLELLEKAKESEKNYDWFQAAKIYEKACDIDKKNILNLANFHEKKGYCLFRFAFQAETNKQFTQRMLQSADSYSKAGELFQKISTDNSLAKAVRCQAKRANTFLWIENNPQNKRKILDDWWSHNLEAIKLFKKTGDKLAIAKIYDNLMQESYDCKYFIELNLEEPGKIRDELINFGEQALEILSKLNDEYQLARTHCWLSVYYLTPTSTIAFKKEDIEKGLNHLEKAIEYSKKIGDFWLLGWTYSISSHAGTITNDPLVKRFIWKTIECGKITKDNYLIGRGELSLVAYSYLLSYRDEDPAKHRENIETSLKIIPETIHHFEIINMVAPWNAHFGSAYAYLDAASIALNIKEKKTFLRKAVENGKKSVEELEELFSANIPMTISIYCRALYDLSEIEDNPVKKKQIIEDILKSTKRNAKILQTYTQNRFPRLVNQSMRIVAKAALAKISIAKKKTLLNEAVLSIDSCFKEIKIFFETDQMVPPFLLLFLIDLFYKFGEIYNELYSITKEKELLLSAIKIYDFATTTFNKIGLINRKAESFWQKAIIQDQMGECIEASKSYKQSSEVYLKAIEKVPQLKNFYNKHSLYMKAWSQIEKAKYHHQREEYDQATNCYTEAALLHEKTEYWSYLAPNYNAWAKLDRGENQSRNEKPNQAIQSFQLAINYFKNTITSIKTNLEKIEEPEEKELCKNLVKASKIRTKYCKVRINIEKAKIFDKKSDYTESSKNYRKATEELDKLINRLESEEEKKELSFIRTLCQAWEKMAQAEANKSSELFLEASDIFEKAKNLSSTEKTSLWALGSSSFCKGLAAKINFQSTFDKSFHSIANKHMKQAANYYKKAGFIAASEYVKATQRLFDAYLYMNSAEDEVDPDKKTKYYQLAEQLLQIASDHFIDAKQPEKTSEVQSVLVTVREEKALAVSLNQIMQAPTVASSSLSFAALTPTSEVSVGLERFQHANIQANLIADVNEVRIGESFCLSVEFVNAGKEPALLTRVENFIPSDFVVVKKPEIYRIEESTLNMKGKQIAPLKLVEVKLTLQASKKGQYALNPQVHYLDELGQNKSLQLKKLEITVEEVLLEDRVSTGTLELDSLLLGGIPNEYAVVLSGSPSNERGYLIKNFLEAGMKENDIIFYVSTEADGLENLLENPNFVLFLCNPKPKTKIPNLLNIYKLRSKTDLTNLSISLAKAYRKIETSKKKRICLETVSDVLLDYGAKATRKWISELITDLGSKGFTMFAVMNPGMHPSDQATAIIDLFDGEISVTQSSDPLDCKKSILVKKLRNQDYIKNPICLTNL